MKNHEIIQISIIIPAYNEALKIEKDIREAFKFLGKSRLKGEVIVSADGCTDNTLEIVNRLQEEYLTLSLINGGVKNGKGGALKKGVEKAQGEIIMFADAGYCVPFEYINDGLSRLAEGYDCALASRAGKKSKIVKKQPLYRQVGSRIFGIIVRNLLGVPRHIKDTQCGFKLYKKEAAKKLFSDLQTYGFMFDAEIILRAKKYKYKMTTFSVEWQSDDDTKFKPLSGSIQNFRELFGIKLKYRL